MNAAEVGIAAGAVALGGAHAWIGTRLLLPALHAVLVLEGMPHATWVRHAWRVAWLMGSVGLLSFAALVLAIDALRSHGWLEPFVLGLSVLLSSSPIMLGTCLGLRLRAKAQRLGAWFTVLGWAVFAVVIMLAWRAARS